MSDSFEVSCPAKVNLFLRVLGKEEDGYHSLETLFCRLDLHDTLTVTRTSGGIELAVQGADLGPPERNLAWRAAEAVLQATGRHFGVRMVLEKRIPAGGGLGGGSSDAAQALLATNRLAERPLPVAELLNLAARLGSDVPFFLSGASLALGWGRGQRLLQLPALPARPALLIVPPFGVSTAAAYQWIDRSMQASGPRGGLLIDPGLLGDWGAIGRMGGNEFESAVFGEHPALRAAFEALARTGPLLCRMAGSGSTLFAVYRSEQDRNNAAGTLGTQHGRVIACMIGGEIVGR